MLLFGIVILIRISYGVITDLYTRQVLSQTGRTANADIKKSSANRGGELVTYSFSVDGLLYSGQAEMGAHDYSLPGDGNKILVRYLPNNPRVNQPAKWQWTSMWDLFPFLLLLSITAIGASVILKALRLRTLMRIGIVAAGRVTGCVPNKKLFTVYYDFAADDNTLIDGSCNLPDEYEVGTSFHVIFLRRNPKRNNCYPVSGFRVAD